MSYKIPEEDCIFCGTCEEECPNEAIDEGEAFFFINPEKCTECVGFFESPRCAEACPLQLPVPDTEHQETKDELLGKFQRLHPG